MEKINDTPSRMDGLHQMAHPKSTCTPAAVCGMSGYDHWEQAESWTQELLSQDQPNTITCMAGGEEMLRVGPAGFWVRGQKVAQDDNEAQAVYNAFKAWMTWAQLDRDYK